MPTVDLITEYVIRYGFQVLGAVLVFAVGTLVARWAGKLTQQWLERHDIFPRGRYGYWYYNSMEDSILAGREVMATIDARLDAQMSRA